MSEVCKNIRKEALRAVLDNIKSGLGSPFDGVPDVVVFTFTQSQINLIQLAHNDDMNAALTFHRDFLPMWVMSHAWGSGHKWTCNLTRRVVDGVPKYTYATSTSLARALLMADLKAIILECED